MLPIRVNGISYECPTTAEDMLLGTFLQLCDLERDEMPEHYREIAEAEDEAQRARLIRQITKKKYRPIIKFMAKAVSIGVGIPYDEIIGTARIEGMPLRILDTLYWEMIQAKDRLYYDENKRAFPMGPIGNAQTFVFPERFMEKSTFGEFAEAAQYEEHAADAGAGMWSAFPKILAVLLRTPEEMEFNDDDAHLEARAEYFKEHASMAVVMHAAFFLLKQNLRLNEGSQIYSMARMVAWQKQNLKNL